MNLRIRWTTTAILVLGSGLGLLYLGTKGNQSFDYRGSIALIRQLKQLDANWELDVLRSRVGTEQSYDSLVEPLVELRTLGQQLRTVTLGDRQRSQLFLRRVDAYQSAIESKMRLVEDFKSHNSVLRNSLDFLPTAASDVQSAIAVSNARTPAIALSAGISRALLETLIYVQAPSAERAADIESDLGTLVDHVKGRSAPIMATLAIFAAHTRTVLREQPEVDSLLNRMAQVPIDERLDALDNIFGDAQRQAESQAQTYRRGLLLFASVLTVLLLYLATQLVRSHTEITRVNRELARLNGTLEHRVQERTRELQALQGELITTAHAAGMAEIATNVLHNVGNVLNSVNVSACIVSERLRDSKLASLERLGGLLAQHSEDMNTFVDSARGRILPRYVGELATELTAERDAVVTELAALRANVEHIKEIVAMQQNFARRGGILEPVHLPALIEDALRLNELAFARQGVTIVRDLAEVAPMPLDKHKILQILVNLVRNAKHACEDAPEKRVTVRLQCTETLVAISVTDTGVGIPAGNLERIFTHGFTTRRDGHGFGLHSGALSAKEMGGSLCAESAGTGLGATFTLTLPLNAAETVDAREVA